MKREGSGLNISPLNISLNALYSSRNKASPSRLKSTLMSEKSSVGKKTVFKFDDISHGLLKMAAAADEYNEKLAQKRSLPPIKTDLQLGNQRMAQKLSRM